jgi:predicted glycoside hydrolase/deacetylase ChbG (UPF0249 family)
MSPQRFIRIFAAVVAFSTPAWAGPARLIVRGDDLGSSHAANTAIIECYRRGIQRSTEVMVPTPWFPEAVELLRQNPGLDVGVHLTLTSEWDRVKWRPLTHAPSLVDEDGYFLPMIWPHAAYPGRAIRERAWDLGEIEREFRAQIEMARRLVPRLSHISGHMGCTDFDPRVAALSRRLAAEYGLLFDVADTDVVKLGYAGPSATAQEKLDSLLAALESLQPDRTYLFIDHPGLDTPEMRALGHIGYDRVAADRQGVTDAWTSPRVREAVARLGIELISYADLRATGPATAVAP